MTCAMIGAAPVRVVLALDKFKGSLTAAAACQAVGAGIRATSPAVVVDEVPIADGGDGTLEVLLGHGYLPIEVEASGPTGERSRPRIGVRGESAFIELAEVCGLGRLPGGQLAALRAGTKGLGEAALAALEAGAASLTVGLGGSASTDGGIGFLQALGANVRDRGGKACAPGAAGLLEVASLDLTSLDERASAADWQLLVDVESPLCGPLGAAQLFGPQKGLTPGEVGRVEEAMHRWAGLLAEETGRDVSAVPGAGAAGGTGAALLAVFGGEPRSGSSHVLRQSGLEDRLRSARLLVTGEGRWDEQTSHGKGPGAALALAQHLRLPAVIVVGSMADVTLGPEEGVIAVHQLRDLESDLGRSMAGADRLLMEIGRRIGQRLAAPTPESASGQENW
ncbi:MAG TPA: glycerate kinase [Intrasporangium sp.]|uniref:glycerate kinase n=1 Tax=Intrasporangium sp. TaxID=1925024 RepID=UPI002D77F972|nr:glycerate kinase [Intrasporangium sp.]HET7398242.1 glycerate kinase [Intrasporangium sp.]